MEHSKLLNAFRYFPTVFSSVFTDYSGLQVMKDVKEDEKCVCVKA